MPPYLHRCLQPDPPEADRTGIDGRPASHGGNGWGWRVGFGNYGLDERPLLVGEVHNVIQNLYPLLSMSGQTMGIYANFLSAFLKIHHIFFLMIFDV
jgi:hypothetical protein